MVPKWIGCLEQKLADNDRHSVRGCGVAGRSLSCCSSLGAFVLALACWLAPHDHVAWGSNAHNLAAVGAAAMFAEWARDSPREHGKPLRQSEMVLFENPVWD